MGKAFSIIGTILGVVILFFGLGFLVEGSDFFLYKFWAPKQENVRRQVFENTQSYVQGKVEYLIRLRYQYQSLPEGSQKSSIRMLILDEASTVDQGKLPIDLQSFIQSLKEGE